MDVFKVAIKRRSIRCFKDVPVPYEVLKGCVEAARLAPSGGNWQVLEYLVVDDNELLPLVFNNIRFGVRRQAAEGEALPSDQPKAYIITLVNTTLEAKTSRGKNVTFYDIGLANENIMLVAWERGVGSCPILWFDQEALKLVLEIPDNYEIGLVLALGYPDENPVLDVFCDSTGPWVDEKGERHVPKRELRDIMHRNRFT